MHIPRLVCAPCQVEMTVESNSVRIELYSDNGHKLKVSSDEYRCPGCKILIALPAQAAIAEGFQPGYDNISVQFSAQFADSFKRSRRAHGR